MASVTFVVAAMIILFQEVSPTEWHRLDDAIYYVDSVTTLPFDEAQSRCQNYDANLARIDSDKIQAFLTTFITPALRDTRCFWIGCHDRETEGRFKWLDGTPVNYDGWAPNQPDNNRGDQDCACLWSRRNNDGHGRWDDEKCTINRNLICQKSAYSFQLDALRSNPGFPLASCSVQVEAEGEILSPDDVKLSVGRTLLTSRPISYSSTSVDGGSRRNTFMLGNITEDEDIFCYVGDRPNKLRSFSLASHLSPVFDFYALPELASAPTIGRRNASSVTVSWPIWIPCLDTGDGPVIGYVIYKQTWNEDWQEVGRVDLGVAGGELQRRMEFVLVGLEAGIEYNISVSAVREGEGGEGPRSPHVTVKTILPELRNETWKDSHAWIPLFWISLVVNIILIVALLHVCTQMKPKKEKKNDLSRLQCAPANTAKGDKNIQHYEQPQPSIVRGQVYQGLQKGGSNDEPLNHVYANQDSQNNVYSNDEHYIYMDVGKHEK